MKIFNKTNICHAYQHNIRTCISKMGFFFSKIWIQSCQIVCCIVVSKIMPRITNHGMQCKSWDDGKNIYMQYCECNISKFWNESSSVVKQGF
jgi:hypothetical protein